MSMLLVVCAECDTVISSVESVNIVVWAIEIEENNKYLKKELKQIIDDLWSLEQDIQRKYNTIIELLEMG